MNEPTVVCGGLAYEEGADLDPDEVAENARLLPLPLDQLPGGGIRHDSIVEVTDPRAPVPLADWGARAALNLGQYDGQGNDTLIYAHSVRASADGMRATFSLRR